MQVGSLGEAAFYQPHSTFEVFGRFLSFAGGDAFIDQLLCPAPKDRPSRFGLGAFAFQRALIAGAFSHYVFHRPAYLVKASGV